MSATARADAGAETAPAKALLAAAVGHHQAGRTAEAELLYLQLIAADPDHADALNLLGLLALERGEAQAAEALIERAVAARPGVADYRNTLGEALRAQGRFDEAEAAFRAALAGEPGFAKAHNNLGMVALGRERPEQACAHFHAALAHDARPARFHLNLGRALIALGRFAEAAEVLEAAAARAPEDAEAQRLLGLACQRAGFRGRAIEAYECALAQAPDLAEVRNNLGVLLAEERRLDEAVEHYRGALASRPESLQTHNNLAMALHRLGRLAVAAAHYETALALDPDSADVLNNFGNLRIEQGRIRDGLALYERALGADPDNDHALVSLLARSSLVCDWQRQAELLPALRARLDAIGAEPERAVSLLPLTFTLPYFCADNALIAEVCRLVGSHYERTAAGVALAAAPGPGEAERRLRVGYLSPDFGDHPIGHVTMPVYRLHDRSQLEVFCYSTLDRGRAGGRYLDEIRSGADHFVDLSALPYRDCAERIAADRIDILVDLTGYMRHSRPQVLALRPAPLQLYWQGHTGSLGARHIDYVIGDPVVMPGEDEALYTEGVIRLPDTFSSAERAPISAAPQARADYGLPDDAIVFCAFNNPLKIEAETFAAWMRVLAAVPRSVLWLSRSGESATADNLSAAAARAGIDPARLVFATRVPDKSVHLARHALGDLFLDTFRFNASTTALDALWAGLPPLTRRGNNAYSRLCESYLRAVGMPELVTDDTEAYVAKAVALAADSQARAALTAKLAEARLTAPLFDAPRFVRHLEAAYRHAWRRLCAGAPPASFDQPAIAAPA